MPQPTKMSARDLQTYPFVMIPKLFFTRFKPSVHAIAAYLAIKYHTSSKTGTSEYTSIPTMAKLVDLSVNTFKKGVAELAKKGALRIRHRSQKTARGKRVSLPNLYELVNLQPTDDEDAPI